MRRAGHGHGGAGERSWSVEPRVTHLEHSMIKMKNIFSFEKKMKIAFLSSEHEFPAKIDFDIIFFQLGRPR